MKAGGASALARSAFSFPVMLALAITVVICLSCRNRLSDPDTWWHLKVGEAIWESRSLPQSDQYSYTTNNQAWIPHEWLGAVSIYAGYKLAGYRGVLLWLWVFGSLLFVLLYVLCCLYSGNAKVSLLGGLAGWFFGTVGLAVRPLVQGYLFLVVELLLIHLARTRNRRWLWALPPLYVVWVNVHGSYMLGLAVLGAYVLSSFVELRLGLIVSSPWNRDLRRLLCLAFLLCIAALLVNPVGVKLVTYPLDFFLFSRQSVNIENVAEWQPLDFRQVRSVALLGVVGTIGLVLLTRQTTLRLDELLVFLLGLGMALRYTRMLFIFGILAAPILCRLLAGLWDYDPNRDNRVANAVLIPVFVALLILGFPTASQIDEQVTTNNPAAAVDFIRRTGLKGRMLNQYVWGGYLIWALPEQKVFIDGRADVFEWTGVFSEYGRWYGLREDPNLLLNKYRIDYCLLMKTAPMAYVLPHLSGWKKIYGDEIAVIFVKQ